MKVLAAYLLANLSGNEPDNSAITKILESVGIEADSARIDLVIKELAGKNIADLVAEGQTKLASMPAGGIAAAPAGGAPAAAGGAAPAAAKEEEKKEEAKEESDEDMGFGLFD